MKDDYQRNCRWRIRCRYEPRHWRRNPQVSVSHLMVIPFTNRRVSGFREVDTHSFRHRLAHPAAWNFQGYRSSSHSLQRSIWRLYMLQQHGLWLRFLSSMNLQCWLSFASISTQREYESIAVLPLSQEPLEPERQRHLQESRVAINTPWRYDLMSWWIVDRAGFYSRWCQRS